MLKIIIKLAVHFQSIYRWNIEKEKIATGKDYPVDNINVSVLIWTLLILIFFLLWMMGILFTPCYWVTEKTGDAGGYVIVALGSSIILSSLITASLFIWSDQLKKALSDVNNNPKQVNVTTIYWQVPLFMFIYLAVTIFIISFYRYNCGLSIINENGFW